MPPPTTGKRGGYCPCARRTPLHRALYFGHLAVAACLLQAGASAEASDYQVRFRCVCALHAVYVLARTPFVHMQAGCCTHRGAACMECSMATPLPHVRGCMVKEHAYARVSQRFAEITALMTRSKTHAGPDACRLDDPRPAAPAACCPRQHQRPGQCQRNSGVCVLQLGQRCQLPTGDWVDRLPRRACAGGCAPGKYRTTCVCNLAALHPHAIRRAASAPCACARCVAGTLRALSVLFRPPGTPGQTACLRRAWGW